jgi:hypothetical protein
LPALSFGAWLFKKKSIRPCGHLQKAKGHKATFVGVHQPVPAPPLDESVRLRHHLLFNGKRVYEKSLW